MSGGTKDGPAGSPTGWRTIARKGDGSPSGEPTTGVHVSLDDEPSTAMVLTFSGRSEEARAAKTPGVDRWVGRVLDDRYAIVERIGAGGMAVVYRAEERGFIKRDVAIKLLSPESALSQATIQRFLQEAQAISDIGHPHVVHIHHVGQTSDGQLYLAMELLRGQTLAEALAELKSRGEVFTWDRLGPMILQICGALQAAHKRSIIHRDIKPGNCFRIDVDGNPDYIKVLDFGIAKIQTAQTEGPDSEDMPLTQQGMFIGTPHYAAPETIVMRPDWPIDGRADQFAVGVMMYHMLTGTLPFAGSSKLDVLYKTAHERPQPLRERAPQRKIAADVEALVMRTLESDPRKRFPSMRALAEAIYETLSLRPRTLPPDLSNPQLMISPQGELIRVETTPSPDRAQRREVTLPGTPRGGEATHPGTQRAEVTRPGSPTASGLRLIEDLSTPQPAGMQAPAAEVTEKTGAEPSEALAPTKGSRTVLIAGAAMLVGLVAVAVTLAVELGVFAKSEPAPVAALPRETPRETPPVRRAEKPPAPAAVPREPAPEVAPVEVVEEETLPPLDPEGEESEQASRPRKIAQQLRSLPQRRKVIDCLLKSTKLVMGVGISVQYPVQVKVDAAGKVVDARMDEGARVTNRGPRTGDRCVLDEVKRLRFASGPEGALTVPATIVVK